MNRTIQAVLAAALLLSPAAVFANDDGQKSSSRQEFKAAFKARREALKPMRRDLRDAMTKLRDQVADKASDKDIQASLDRVEKARAALRAERQKLLASLTPTERAKLALRLNGKMGSRHGRGHNRKQGLGRGRWNENFGDVER